MCFQASIWLWAVLLKDNHEPWQARTLPGTSFPTTPPTCGLSKCFVVFLTNQDSGQALEEDMDFSQAARNTRLLHYFTALTFLSYAHVCMAVS